MVVFARDDDYFFGVLHSKLHEVWSLRMGTWLGKGNDPRYTPTTTFETFPFPWSPGEEDESSAAYAAISTAAQQLHEEREAWLSPLPNASKSPLQSGGDTGGEEKPPAGEDLKHRTLTNLYNALAAYRAMGDKQRDMPDGIKPDAWAFAPRLADLHDALDAAVCAAYGWDAAILADDEAILRHLLALNLARAAAQPSPRRDDRDDHHADDGDG